MMDQRLYPASSIGYRALLHLPGPESHKLSSDIHHTLTHDSTLHSSTLAPGKLGFIAHNRSGSNIKYGGGKVFLFLTYSQLKEMLAFLLFSKSVLCSVLCCVWYPLSGPQLTVIHSNLHSWLINPGSNCFTRAAPPPMVCEHRTKLGRLLLIVWFHYLPLALRSIESSHDLDHLEIPFSLAKSTH